MRRDEFICDSHTTTTLSLVTKQFMYTQLPQSHESQNSRCAHAIIMQIHLKVSMQLSYDDINYYWSLMLSSRYLPPDNQYSIPPPRTCTKNTWVELHPLVDPEARNTYIIICRHRDLGLYWRADCIASGFIEGHPLSVPHLCSPLGVWWHDTSLSPLPTFELFLSSCPLATWPQVSTVSLFWVPALGRAVSEQGEGGQADGRKDGWVVTHTPPSTSTLVTKHFVCTDWEWSDLSLVSRHKVGMSLQGTVASIHNGDKMWCQHHSPLLQTPDLRHLLITVTPVYTPPHAFKPLPPPDADSVLWCVWC